MVGEVKKDRYIYYHCTGYKGRCDEPYVLEEILEKQFSEMLGRLSFDEEVLAWVCDALRASHSDEKREHEAAIGRLRAEYDRLRARVHAMYVDKLDGKVDGAFFERMSAEWQAQQDYCLREIERHQTADRSYLEEGVRLLELARSAQRLFAGQESREKRRLLNFVVSNSTWKSKKLEVTMRQPFDMLAETTARAGEESVVEGPISPKSEIWLPGPPPPYLFPAVSNSLLASQNARTARASLISLRLLNSPSVSPNLTVGCR
jgi:hypothetical protein